MNQKQDLFTQDFCDECGNRVDVDALVENNEHWICHQCDDELQKEGEAKMAQLEADAEAEEMARLRSEGWDC